MGTFTSGGGIALVIGLLGVSASAEAGPIALVLTSGFLAAAYVGLNAIVKKRSLPSPRSLIAWWRNWLN